MSGNWRSRISSPRRDSESLDRVSAPERPRRMFKDGEQRGQEGQPVEHREGDDYGAGEAYGVEVGHVEEEETHKAYGHGEPREQDGAARRGHGARQGFWHGVAADLLTETAHDEERVVYGYAEPDHGDDVGRVDGDVHQPRQEEGPREAAGDGQDAHADGQPGRGDGAEDEEQHQQRQGQGDRLGAFEVSLRNPLEVLVERHVPRRDD